MNTNDNIASSEYINLKVRLDNIKEAFKVDEFKHVEWDLLTDAQRDYARAYIALCHAEIESYLEQKTISVIDKALDLWNSSRKVSLPLLALFAHFQFIETNNNTNEKINMIIHMFKRDRIKKNHGIKEIDLKKLFKPIGVDIEAIDTAWISTLDSYGTERGETVHVSAQVQQPINISDLIEKIRIIKEGALDFEIIVDNLISD